jgi:hypothetical protein
MNNNIKYNINLIDSKLKEVFNNVEISEKQGDDTFLITVSDIKGDSTFDVYKVLFKVHAKDLLPETLSTFNVEYYANPLSMESDLIKYVVYISSINDILLNIIKHKRFNDEYLSTITETKLPYYKVEDKKLYIYLSVIKKLFAEYNMQLEFSEFISSKEKETTQLDEFLEKEVSGKLICTVDSIDNIDVSSIKVIQNILLTEFKEYAKDANINMYNKLLTIEFEVESKDDLVNIDAIEVIK